MTISAQEHDPVPAQGRRDTAARAWTESLYATHARSVGAICRALLRDRTEAEDAAQQVFLSAHRALLNGSTPREPGAWLATIARYECWARIRSRMREPLAVADVEELEGLPDPVAEAIRRCDLAAFWTAIGGLPRQQRDALLLRELGGLTYEEVAAALAVTTPAVESLLFRARQRMRERLQAAYASFNDGSWLSGLGRLIGGGAPAAASKAVALGLGTATVATGTLVATPMLTHHPHSQQAAHVVVAAAPAALSREQRTGATPVSFHVPLAHTARHAAHETQDEASTEPAVAEPADRHERSGGDGSSSASGDSPSSSGDRSGGSGGSSGDGATSTTSTSDGSGSNSGSGSRDGGSGGDTNPLASAPTLALPQADGGDVGSIASSDH